MKVDIYNTDKKYNIIYADPPWRFSQGIHRRKDFTKKYNVKEELNIHYKTMSDKEIFNLDVVGRIADDQCVLFLWTTDAHLKVAIESLTNWGFKYKTIAFVWNKVKPSIGKWNVKQCEICLLATKGTAHKLMKSFKERQYIEHVKEQHSKKPDEIRNRIVGMLGDIPRIELFARQYTDGWDCWGNEV